MSSSTTSIAKATANELLSNDPPKQPQSISRPLTIADIIPSKNTSNIPTTHSKAPRSKRRLTMQSAQMISRQGKVIATKATHGSESKS